MSTRVSALTKFRQTARDKGKPETCTTGAVIPLDLPHNATLRKIGLDLPENLTLAQWQDIGLKLATCGTGIQFGLGDFWVFGHHKYGDRKALAEAKRLPFCFGTLMNYGSVARAVPTSLRNEALTFNHHVAVAKLTREYQEEFLAKAARFKWSAKQLRQEIHEASVHWLDRQPKVRASRWFMAMHEALKRAAGFSHFFQCDDSRFDYADALDVREFAATARETADRLARIADGIDEYLAARLEAGDKFKPRTLEPVYGPWNAAEEKKTFDPKFTAAPTTFWSEDSDIITAREAAE
jgi:hypothetical protein